MCFFRVESRKTHPKKPQKNPLKKTQWFWVFFWFYWFIFGFSLLFFGFEVFFKEKLILNYFFLTFNHLYQLNFHLHFWHLLLDNFDVLMTMSTLEPILYHIMYLFGIIQVCLKENTAEGMYREFFFPRIETFEILYSILHCLSD